MILITWLKVHNTEQEFLMFKYMINIIWYGSYRITSCINPRPISSLELKLSEWYWCLWLIWDVIQKEPYNILYVIILATCILKLSPLNLYHISFMHYFGLIDHLAFNPDSLGCGGVGEGWVVLSYFQFYFMFMVCKFP